MNMVYKYGPIVGLTFAAVYLLRVVTPVSSGAGNSTGY